MCPRSGPSFTGRCLLLGQFSLLPNRPEKSLQIRTVRSPGSFRWVATRLRTRVRVYQVLDYEKVKFESTSYAFSISVPAEELWVPEGEAVFPMRQAFEQALEGFTGPKCPDLKGF